MNLKTSIGVVVALIAGVGAWYWLGQSPVAAPSDYKNVTITIDGQSVTLVNGRAESPAAPGSASTVVTQYFGNEATGDLSGDGLPDTAFLITQSSGGSGTFYYVVAAIKTAEGYHGTDAVLIGDRVAPQTTEIKDGKLIVNYADRALGEPMTTVPSVGKSLYLKLDPVTLQFGIVDQNFSGEADPAKMKLDMKTWNWVSVQYNDGTRITPNKPEAFTLTFTPDPPTPGHGTLSASTDCNGVGGEYAVSGSSIVFSKGISTMMACLGSQEQDFTKALFSAASYHFTAKGELILDLKLDSGTMTFR